MKTINLQQEPLTLSQLFEVAQAEPILLLTPDGQEFILSQADRFEQEVEALRNSQRFQAFLDGGNVSNIGLYYARSCH